MRIKKWLKELVIFSVIALMVIGAIDWWRAPTMPEDMDFSQQMTLSGQPIDLQQLSQDRPVVIYFWATWCGVCKLTTPMVRGLANDNVQVVTVALRSGADSQLAPALEKAGFTLPTINDEDGIISDNWGIGVTPTFAIIYKGNMVHSTTGWTSAWGIKFRLWLTEKFS